MKFRKTAAFLLSVLMLGGASAPAFAAETGENTAAGAAYTVEYSQVEQLVRNQNLQVQNNGLTVGNLSDENATKKKYQQLEKTVQSTQNALNAILKKPTTPETQDLQTVAQGTSVALTSLLSMLSAQDDVSDDDYKLTELQMDAANDQLVESAQGLFSVYYQLKDTIGQMANNRVTLEDAMKAAQARYAAGQDTSSAVTDAENAAASLDNTTADLQNQLKQIGYQMNQLLGHSYNDPVTFGAMPAPDTAYAGKINLQNDIATATAASYDVQVKQQQLALARDGTGENRDQIDIAGNNIALATQKVGPGAEKQYDAIQKAQAALTLDQKNLSSAKQKRDYAQMQYQLGTLSQIDLNAVKNDYLKQQTAVQTDSAVLFWNIETYKWILKGLPAPN
jgi:outer membrane protein TolC